MAKNHAPAWGENMKIFNIVFSLLFSIIIFTIACGNADKEKPETSGTKMAMTDTMKLTSPDFNEGEMISPQFTCDSTDVSPLLVIENPPEDTKSFALICDDPDAPHGTWVHWVVFNIPADMRELPERFGNSGLIKKAIDSSNVSIVQGKNDFGHTGYGGPCPPPGRDHRYFFRLYALDVYIEFVDVLISRGITRTELDEAMEGHILAETTLMGKYKR